MKTLESRPIQIVLCILMIFDAAVVIAEILLDLHAMRSKSVIANRTTTYDRMSLSQAVQVGPTTDIANRI